jgi:hypothetical protein
LPAYNVFVPGQIGALDPSTIEGGLAEPDEGAAQTAGLMIVGVTASAPVAAGMIVQEALQGNQHGFLHVILQSGDTPV